MRFHRTNQAFQTGKYRRRSRRRCAGPKGISGYLA